MSPQNSRIGMRVDEMVKGAKVLGYWESDFLGGVNNPPVGNLAVSTNSYLSACACFSSMSARISGRSWEARAGA